MIDGNVCRKALSEKLCWRDFLFSFRYFEISYFWLCRVSNGLLEVWPNSSLYGVNPVVFFEDLVLYAFISYISFCRIRIRTFCECSYGNCVMWIRVITSNFELNVVIRIHLIVGHIYWSMCYLCHEVYRLHWKWHCLILCHNRSRVLTSDSAIWSDRAYAWKNLVRTSLIVKLWFLSEICWIFCVVWEKFLPV